MYVGPEVWDQLEEANPERELPEYLANSRFHKVLGARWRDGGGWAVAEMGWVCV